MTTLEVNVGGVIMKNPVACASGTCGYGDVFTQSYDPAELGAVVTKGISLEPRPGNPSPRMTETPSGMLNSIGLENVGLEAFVKGKLPWLAERGATVVVNILGDGVGDYVRLAAELSSAAGVHGLELNVSCPNVKAGGIAFGSDPRTLEDLVKQARKETRLPLWVKLSPNVTDIAEMARAAEAGGADAVSLINTVRAMVIDVEQRRPVLAAGIGGLSGPAIRPIAVRMVHEAAQAVKVPVVGIGGIITAEDALEFIIAGATAVQVGTASFIDPRAPIKVIEGIKSYLERQGIRSISEIIGCLQYPR